MIVIADTSALIALAVCDGLDLLIPLFQTIAVPQVVFKECVIPEKPHAQKLQAFLKDKIELSDITLPLELPTQLGRGEIEAMFLYKTLQADYLLIDDYRARKVAQLNQINIIGSFGILLLAKKQGIISHILPYVQKLIDSDLYFDEGLIQQILKLANE